MKRRHFVKTGLALSLVLGAVPLAHAQSGTVLQNFTGNFYGGGDGTTTPAAPTYNGYTPTTYDGFIPPDTMGSVGSGNFIQMINGGYSVYDKTGTLLNATGTTDSDFWTAAGISSSVASSISDPHILFDPNTNRWFASEITVPSTNSNQFLVAVSKDSNPLDGFTGYSYNANPASGSRNLFADFDMLGINSQGVYIGANMFTAAGGYGNQDILTVSKSDLLSGAATPASTLIYRSSGNTNGFGIRPVVDQDNGGTAANLAEPALGVSNSVYGQAYADTIGGTITTATLTHNATITFTSATNGASTAQQPGGDNTIDTGDDRFSGYVVKQGGVIYAVNTLADPTTGLADIHITGINATTKASVIDQVITGTGKGTGGTNLDLYYPSIAINATGGVVIGYTGSGPSDYASGFAVTGQLAASGTSIAFGTPIETAVGQGTYDVTFGGGSNRWGDYSSTTLDPTDPSKFWTVQEFAIGTNEWGTQITEIGLAAAPEPSQFAAIGIGLLGLGGLILRRRAKGGAAA